MNVSPTDADLLDAARTVVEVKSSGFREEVL